MGLTVDGEGMVAVDAVRVDEGVEIPVSECGRLSVEVDTSLLAHATTSPERVREQVGLLLKAMCRMRLTVRVVYSNQ